jgi:hypothetical protein
MGGYLHSCAGIPRHGTSLATRSAHMGGRGEIWKGCGGEVPLSKYGMNF